MTFKLLSQISALNANMELVYNYLFKAKIIPVLNTDRLDMSINITFDIFKWWQIIKNIMFLYKTIK